MRTAAPGPAGALRALITATVLIGPLAACGGSPAPTPAPATAGASSATDSGSVRTDAGSVAGDAGPAGDASADCTRATRAATDVSLEMQFLYQADSAARWQALTDPSAPVGLDAARFAAGVAALGSLPGGADVAARYAPIATLETEAAVAADPWGGGSGPAARAHDETEAAFIDLGVALTLYLEGLGCAP